MPLLPYVVLIEGVNVDGDGIDEVQEAVPAVITSAVNLIEQ